MNNIPNPNDTRLGPFHVPYHHQYKRRPHRLTFGMRVGHGWCRRVETAHRLAFEARVGHGCCRRVKTAHQLAFGARVGRGWCHISAVGNISRQKQKKNIPDTRDADASQASVPRCVEGGLWVMKQSKKDPLPHICLQWGWVHGCLSSLVLYWTEKTYYS